MRSFFDKIVRNYRLYLIGCMWGFLLVILWRVLVGMEGVLATHRLGYGRCWLPVAALGLALTWQARKCFHHSCESDLFQASFNINFCGVIVR